MELHHINYLKSTQYSHSSFGKDFLFKDNIHQKRAGGSPIDAKTTQYVDFQFIDFHYKICYNFSSEKR